MRRRYITHPNFQYSFIFSFVVSVLFIVCTLTLISWGALLYASKNLPISQAQVIILESGANQMFYVVFIMTPILLILIAIFGFFLSYRFVGPLTRLEGWIEKALLGEAPPIITLRKNDELTRVNQLLGQIAKKNKGKF